MQGKLQTTILPYGQPAAPPERPPRPIDTAVEALRASLTAFREIEAAAPDALAPTGIYQTAHDIGTFVANTLRDLGHPQID